MHLLDENIITQPDVAIPLQPPELQSCPSWKTSISLMHSLLRDEIDSFCKQVQSFFPLS